MALKRSKSVKFKVVKKTVVRNGHRVQTHVHVKKQAYKNK